MGRCRGEEHNIPAFRGHDARFRRRRLLWVLAVLGLLLASRPVAGARRRDGIVVTLVDYQGLRAFKLALVDTRGLLSSWNDTGLGACSGGWAGIKCVGGQVVAIQLPSKGLGGTISEKIGQLTALRKLSLHHNFIGGQLPAALGLLPHLRGLHLFHNRFSGSIPPSIGRCPLLQALDLSNNLLTGAIPGTLSNSTRLYRLNLSYNNLSGAIPAAIGNITTLSRLDLSENNFTGEIPATLARLTNLTAFNVSDNDLSGPVPPLLSEKFNSSSFRGNVQLCGYSAAVPCSAAAPSPSLPLQVPSPSVPPTPGVRKLHAREVVLLVAGALLVILVVLCCALICCLLKKRSDLNRKHAAGGAPGRGVKPAEATAAAAATEVETVGEMGGKLVHFDGPLAFTADDLLCATAEIMGKSTYGTVYRATLEDGKEVAVKRLREKIAKGQKEFEAEVNALGRIRHPNLLALRAYYLGPKGEKLLVFDYMPKGSLAAFLHARGPDSPVDWPTRMKIAIGTARGLLHLHSRDNNLVHGNLTGRNILLDETTEAKIADYGLSRLTTGAASTNVIAAAGALGYRAPELSKTKKASIKADVYSLGVVMLELLTGKSPGEATNGVELPEWVASIVKEEWTNEVFDLELMRDAEGGGGGTTADELLNTLKLALHCVDPSPAARPDVQQVLRQLEEIKPGPSGSATAGLGAEEDASAAVPSTEKPGQD